ncbi:hypothetical protein L7F22_062218 [Adiantum nelumboides]|nr:hypothetical protein [Adiantum nelumboides]
MLLDFEKAYDIADRGFLEGTLYRMKFLDAWIRGISAFDRSAFAAVTIGGHVGRTFTLSRSVRQGCHLAPYLFPFFANSMALYLSGSTPQIQGLHMPIDGFPDLVVQEYVDDTMSFCQYDSDTLDRLQSTCFLLCQLISWHKSSGFVVWSGRCLEVSPQQQFEPVLASVRRKLCMRCYIRFIRKVNENRGAEGRDETKKAFDFMLGHIGMDIGAGAVWMEYIAFLKATPASLPQEESQRMTAVRKAYQRAVLVPIHLVEQLWKDYENFENSVSRTLAKSLLAEYQPKHFSARAVYRERKKLCERIDSSMLAVPPTGSVKEEQQCSAWKQLLAFEKGNPQMLDPTSLTKRVAFTFEQCLMYLYHYPEIWCDYASWHAQNGSPETATVVFQRALKALPDKTLLHYAFAEFEETRGNIQEAKKIYKNLVKNTATASSLAHIQFIRFVQRMEGTESALKALVEARKSPLCTYHVYVASAMMVLCIEKDQKIARDIFEMGLKKYIHEPAYVLEYADFLCRLNDDQNVRALFERALSVLPPEESVEVWNRFVLFEQTYGDLSSMLKVQQRRKDALMQFGDEGAASIEHSLQQLISRYRYLDLWPCSAQDLDHLARQQVMSAFYCVQYLLKSRSSNQVP